MDMTDMQFVGITELRSKTKEIFDLIKKDNLPVVVMRESIPEAVIVSYKDYRIQEKEKKQIWNSRLDELARTAKPHISRWLSKKGYKPDKVTGDMIVEILEKEDEKSRR